MSMNAVQYLFDSDTDSTQKGRGLKININGQILNYHLHQKNIFITQQQEYIFDTKDKGQKVYLKFDMIVVSITPYQYQLRLRRMIQCLHDFVGKHFHSHLKTNS